MIRFYVRSGGEAESADPALPAALSFELWRPRPGSWRPRGLPLLPYSVWTLFHRLRVFPNRELGIVLIRDGELIVHSALVTPPYFRFPHMGARDVQIGAIFTHPQHRGRGLARIAISTVCREWAKRVDRIWYIVEDDNAASIKVIESSGFAFAGIGERTAPLGFRPFGRFRLLKRAA
jgi:RimJ/RimL family protein N-acetyltransferase